MEGIIALSPVLDIDRQILPPLTWEIRRLFELPAEDLPLLDGVDFAFDPVRNQYHSTAILKKLSEKLPPGVIRVVALTRVDLFIPILTYVFGEAELGGKSCIVSSHRLRNGLPPGSGETFRLRMIKEAIHELGHTFDLRHCRDRRCVMHYCRSIADVDRKETELCRYCLTLLDDRMRNMGLRV
jgi:archaemetzincin